MKQIKWAIVGTGYIANEFVKGMKEVDDAALTAVVSRSLISGKAFAQKYDCKNVYTNFQKMLEKETIDVVYIAVPNDCHFSYIMEALDRLPILRNGENVATGLIEEFDRKRFIKCMTGTNKKRAYYK